MKKYIESGSDIRVINKLSDMIISLAKKTPSKLIETFHKHIQDERAAKGEGIGKLDESQEDSSDQMHDKW